MGDNNNKKSLFSNLKIHVHLGIIAVLTVFLYYVNQHSVTFADLTTGIASVSVLFWLLFWLFDLIVDTGKVYSKIAGKYTGIVAGIFFFVFFAALTGIMYALLIAAGTTTGAVTMSIAMILAFLVVMPKTGTSIWILYLYIAATIVTGGHYLVLLPHLSNFVSP